jgi:hypothetical protein
MLRAVTSRTDWVQSWVVEYGGDPQLACLIGAVKAAMALKSLHSANLQNFCPVPQYNCSARVLLRIAHREHAMRWPAQGQASGMMNSHLLVVSGVK